MISINNATTRTTIRWLSGNWRDKAGHIFEMDEKKGTFTSKQHGSVAINEWKVIDEKETS